MWKFRVWKWCHGFGVDISLGKRMRHRLLGDKELNAVSYQILLKSAGLKRKRYFLLDEEEFVHVDDSGMYKVVIEI